MAPSPAEAVADEAELGKRLDGRMTVGSCFRAVRVAIPDIEEPASCGVNNGKGEVVPGGSTKCQSRTKLHQWKLEGSRCPGLSRWLDDNSPAPAFDQIAPRTNPKLVLLDKEPETLGSQFQVAIRLFCGCLWGDDLPPRAAPHPMLVPAPVEGREGRASSGTRATEVGRGCARGPGGDALSDLSRRAGDRPRRWNRMTECRRRPPCTG